jgi:hypothetical protein
MTTRLNPKICPMCGKPTRNNATICISCLSKKKVGKNKPDYLKVEKRDAKLGFKRFYRNGNSIKIKLILGFLICGFTLPHIVITTIIGYNSYYLYFLFQFFNPGLLFITIPSYLIGLGLIFYSSPEKFKRIFLLIYGYMLFTLSFFILPPINYYDFRLVSFFLMLIDVPLLITIFLGIIVGLSHSENSSILNLSTFPLIFSHIIIFFIIYTMWGY